MTRIRTFPLAAALAVLVGLSLQAAAAAGLDDAVGQVVCSRPGGGGGLEQCLEDAVDHERFCSAAAFSMREACGAEAEDDFHTARAICFNLADEEQRDDCLADAHAERAEGHRSCSDGMRWRLAACNVIGEEPYDPQLDPADFDTDYHHLTHPNPYFPLGIGNRWEYVSGSEFNVVQVLDETKLIEGVTCAVVHDEVFEAGDLFEDTDDWFCQAHDGAVYYFGEETKGLESFDGDNPRVPELVSIDGSFKHGRDGDKGGLIFLATPHVGDAYLEEHSLGNAEDVSEILSTTYSFGGPNPELDRGVPQALADYLCAGDCVITKNYSLLEPAVLEFKYYARGIGVFLEVEHGGSVTVRLTACNFDARCVALPQP